MTPTIRPLVSRDRWLAFARTIVRIMNRMFRVLCSIVVAVPLLSEAQAPAPNENVPFIQGGAGSCSLELTVIGADGKPAYAATVKVHIAYGFGGMRRLDLEARTNSNGKVKFAGLPARVQRPPLEFHASKDEFAVSRRSIRQPSAKPNMTSHWRSRKGKTGTNGRS